MNGCLSEDDRKIIWEEHVERIMTEENEWDQMTEVDVLKGLLRKLTCEKMMKAIREKNRKAARPS